jgi:phospholipase D1/2
MGLVHNNITQNAGGETMDVERKASTGEGKEVNGFANSIVPTPEEQTVAEHRPQNGRIDVSSNGEVEHQTVDEKHNVAKKSMHYANGTTNGIIPEARVEDGTLFGTPANAATSPRTDERPPRASGEVNDADEAEKAPPGARATIQKHPNHKIWAPLTPKPRVDPDGFEDPISDAFWNKVWVASAAHNVRSSFFWIQFLLHLAS